MREQKTSPIVLAAYILFACFFFLLDAVFAKDPAQTKRSRGVSSCPWARLAQAKSSEYGANEARTREVLGTALYDPRPFRHPFSESDAIIRSRIELKGSVRPGQTRYFDSGRAVEVTPDKRDIRTYDGRTYYELPNSTGFTVKHPRSGKTLEFVIARGIRPYTNIIRPVEGRLNDPQGYVSDLLLFQRKGEKLEFVKTLFLSSPEEGFYFEDPRISLLHDDSGNPHYYLSGTIKARHAPGSDAFFIRNGYIELSIDKKTGRPDAIALDSFKRDMLYMSPPPARNIYGGYVGVDAKNGLIEQRKNGQIVVLTRFRPHFGKDGICGKYRAKYGSRIPQWDYAEQAFVFENLRALREYDWANGLDDLFAAHLGVAPFNSSQRVRPIEASIVATEKSFKEHYPQELLAEGKPTGFGPGTRAVRVVRRDNRVYLSDGSRAPELFAGEIPVEFRMRGNFFVDEGQEAYISFDHKFRYLNYPIRRGKASTIKRVYTGRITVWDSSLTKPLVFYDDVIQPRELHQIGLTGILDLQLAGYEQGVSILESKISGVEMSDSKTKERKHFLRSYGGAADAHTESFDFDIVRLGIELAPNSKRFKSGQAYVPGPIK